MTKKNLQLVDAINGDLKLIRDEDGTDTALELATDKLRVTGGLDVLGDIEIKGKLVTSGGGASVPSAGTGASVDIESGDDIKFNSLTGTVSFWSGSYIVNEMQSGANHNLKLYPDGATSGGVDFASLNALANGALIIETTSFSQADITLSTQLGNIVLDSMDDIILDSKDGQFLMKKDGVEFSAENSAYAGMILGYTAIGIDSTRDSVQPSASFAITDADHKVTFVAPPSGKVEIEISIMVISVAIRWLDFGLSDDDNGDGSYTAIDFPNTDDVTNEHRIGDIQIEDLARPLNHKWVVEGLTAGTSYTWWLSAKTEQAGRMTLHWGGANTSEYAPFIMKATALPETVYTG